MTITIRYSNDVAVLSLSGRFDAHLAPALQERIKQINVHQLVVNFAGVSFIDSVALATLTTALKHCRQAGGDLRLCEMQKAVRIIFELTGLNRAFDLFEREEDAISAFAKAKAM